MSISHKRINSFPLSILSKTADSLNSTKMTIGGLGRREEEGGVGKGEGIRRTFFSKRTKIEGEGKEEGGGWIGGGKEEGRRRVGVGWEDGGGGGGKQEYRKRVKTMEINWQNLFTDYKAKLQMKRNLSSGREEEGGGRREEGGRTVYNQIAPSTFLKDPIFETPSFRRLFTSYLEEKTDFESLLKLKNFPNLYKYDEESPKKLIEREEEGYKEDFPKSEGVAKRREGGGVKRRDRGGKEEDGKREEGGGRRRREEGGWKREEGGGKRRREEGGKEEGEEGGKEGEEGDEKGKNYRRKSIIGGGMLMSPYKVMMNNTKKTSNERFESLRNLIKARVQYKREIRSTDSEKTADLLNPRFLQKFYSIYQEYVEKIGTKDLLSANPDKNYYQKSLPTYRRFFKNFTFIGESRVRTTERGEDERRKETISIEKNQVFQDYLKLNANSYLELLKEREDRLRIKKATVPHISHILKKNKSNISIELPFMEDRKRVSFFEGNKSTLSSKNTSKMKTINERDSPTNRRTKDELKPTDDLLKFIKFKEDLGFFVKNKGLLRDEAFFLSEIRKIDHISQNYILDNLNFLNKNNVHFLTVMDSLKNRSRLESQTNEVLDRKINYLIQRQKEIGMKEESSKKENIIVKTKEQEEETKEDGKGKTLELTKEKEEERNERGSMEGGQGMVVDAMRRKSEIGRRRSITEKTRVDEGKNQGRKEETITVRRNTEGVREEKDKDGRKKERKKGEKVDEEGKGIEGKRKRNGRYVLIERNKVGTEEHFGSDDDSSLPSLTEATLDSLYAKSIDLQKKILNKNKMGFGGRIKQFMRLEDLSKTVQKANLQKLTEK